MSAAASFWECPCPTCALDYFWGRTPGHATNITVTSTQDSAKPTPKEVLNSTKELVYNSSAGPQDSVKPTHKSPSKPTKHNPSTGTLLIQGSVRPTSRDVSNPTKQKLSNSTTSLQGQVKPISKGASNPIENNTITPVSLALDPVKHIPEGVPSFVKEEILDPSTKPQDPPKSKPRETLGLSKEKPLNSSTSPQDSTKPAPKVSANSTKNNLSSGVSVTYLQYSTELVLENNLKSTKELVLDIDSSTDISVAPPQDLINSIAGERQTHRQDPQNKIKMAIDASIVDAKSNDLPTGPSPDDCLQRLQMHTTKEKKGLGKKLFESLDKKYGKTASDMVGKLIEAGCEQREVAMDLSILILYDLVILIDDSTSMASSESTKTLTNTLKEIVQIYNLANENGIKSIRFINHHKGKGNVKLEDLDNVVDRCSRVGVTRIGTELHRKILIPFALGSKEKKVTLTKPLLIIVITDGTVEGERKGLLEEVIINCNTILKKREQGEEAVAFQFIRIGRDPDAIKLLRDLDDHPKVGKHIDCLPDDVNLEDIDEPKKWKDIKWNVMAKILVGAMVPHWDDHDKEIELEDLQLGGDESSESSPVVDDDDEDD